MTTSWPRNMEQNVNGWRKLNKCSYPCTRPRWVSRCRFSGSRNPMKWNIVTSAPWYIDNGNISGWRNNTHSVIMYSENSGFTDLPTTNKGWLHIYPIIITFDKALIYHRDSLHLPVAPSAEQELFINIKVGSSYQITYFWSCDLQVWNCHKFVGSITITRHFTHIIILSIICWVYSAMT